MDFQNADQTLLPHLFKTTETILHSSFSGSPAPASYGPRALSSFEQPPLVLAHTYDSCADVFAIKLIAEDTYKNVATWDIPDLDLRFVFYVEKNTFRICGFEVLGASKCIAKNVVNPAKFE